MGLWLPQGVTAPEGTQEPARQKVCGVCVGGDFQQEEREGVREVVWPLSVRVVCFGCVLGGCAQVIRLEVLFF